MATVRLHDVTKIYPRGGAFAPRPRFVRRQYGVDRALAERIAAQVDQEHAHARQAAQHGPVAALDHLNLTVLNGQTMAVIGPSGCGKSTLLRVVAGLEPDYTGQVFYDGQDVRNIPAKDRYIGMVFQNYALYPHFAGRGNLAFFFKLRGVSDEETEARIRVTSEIMGIGFNELLKRRPGTLSGGQQQRVAIARAIVRNPRLFLLDEPLSNLDAKLRSQTRSEIKRLLRRFQITTIYVTHDQTEAIALGDRIAVMRAGRIEQVGAYQVLRQNPVNTFVAGFVGSPPMNLFDGGVVDHTDLTLDQLTLPLPNAIRDQAQPGQAITLGIRPEAAHLVAGDQPVPAGVRWCGAVEMIEPDFAHHIQLVHLRTGELSYTVTAALEVSLDTGDEVEIVFPTDELYFFDSHSEQRIA